MNQRLQYIDIAKGLLVCLVILYHTPAAIIRYCDNCNPVVNDIGLYTRMWYESFFMPAFFLINGFCSRFQEERKTFYSKLLKTIVLPTCVFRFINPIIFDFDANPLRLIGFFKPNSGEWFISALIVGRVIVYESRRLINSEKCISCLLGLLTIIAILINRYADPRLLSFYYWPQGLCAAFFIWVGHSLRSYTITTSKLLGGAILYFIVICVINGFGLHRPVMVVKLAVSLYELPLFILLAVTGTCSVLVASKYIKSKFFEYYGRNSLIVYLTQWATLKSLTKLVSKYIDITTVEGSIIVSISTFILTVIICAVFVTCLDNKYGKYIVGKF